MTDRLDRHSLPPEPFEILEEVAMGGMARVFRARDRASGKLLAVKVLKEGSAAAARFALEAEVLAKLRHPAIVEYAYHGVTRDGDRYLAMEWIDGDNLHQRLASGPLSLGETLRVARTIAEALAVAHAAGVVHRDIKPSNVLYTEKGGAVKVADFGVARSNDASGLTRTGDAIGTPGYMAPEQARGAKIDARADLFSLGCVIFRCLSGRVPFAGADILQVATKLALEEAPLLRQVAPTVPIEVEALVAKLLEKDPEARPASAIEVRQALDRLLEGSDRLQGGTTGESRGPEAEPRRALTPRWWRKASRSRVLALVLAGLLPVAIGLFARRRAETPAPDRSAQSASSAQSAAPTPKDAPLLSAADRAALDRACHEWASAIEHAQRPDGSFAGEVRDDPTGWDTGQQLFALAEARHACGGVGPAPLLAAANALERLRVDDGWIGPKKRNAPDLGRAQTPAIAWALLALHAVSGVIAEPTVAKAAARARMDLLRSRNPDGGFRHHPSLPGPSTLYSSLLAGWALAEASDADGGKAAPEVAEVAAWLRRGTIAASEDLRAPGFTEQLAWFLVHAEQRGIAPADDEARRVLVQEIVAHCRPDATGACARAAHETGRIRLDVDAGHLVTLWHPWATLAAHELALARPDDAQAAKALAPIARWGVGELRRATDVLAAAPEYKLAEYLIVASTLLGQR
jgi:protein kinase-like protein